MDSPVDILLVDDNPSNLLAMEALLGDLGARVVKARSGSDALKCLLEQDFALIILDIQMPEMDGFETAAMIRGREKTRRIPIIFLTAFNRSDREIHRGYALGAVDFLFKPIVPEVLRAKVAVFADLHRKTEEVRRQAELLQAAERQVHERRLAEERQRWEAALLRQQIEHERTSNARLYLLASIANQLLFSTDPERFLGYVYRQVSETLGLEAHACLLAEGERLRPLALGGLGEHGRDGATSPFFARVAARREPAVVHHLADTTDPVLDGLRREGVRAAVVFPMLVEDRLVGILGFFTRARDRVEPDEVEVVRIAADQTAMALERVRLGAELQSRVDALAEADRRKEEFLAMLAHELRNPLAPITAALKIFQLAEAATPQLARARDAMDRQVQHLVRIVNGLLDAARLSAGTIPLHRQSVELAAVVHQAVQTSAPAIEARHHALIVAPVPLGLTLHADPDRLAQTVANLLDNAAKYTEPGGRIELAVRRDDGHVEISVRDNGRGIAPEQLPGVFGLFAQAERTREMAQGGLGVGLTLVKRIAELHGGGVVARSEGEGRGSEFVVRLPLAAAPAVAAPALPRFGPVARGLRIVLVDDNADIRTTLADQLELLGYRVEVAETGPEGIARIRESRPELALIDISLPGLTGYDVARELRADPELRTRLVAMTGYGQPEDRRRALDAGFDEHLVKPIDIDDLFRLLQ